MFLYVFINSQGTLANISSELVHQHLDTHERLTDRWPTQLVPGVHTVCHGVDS